MTQGREVTDTQVERMLDGLRMGMTRRAASRAAGYSKTTFYRMLENDADGTLGTAIEKAEAEAEATYTALVAKAANDPKNWTAAAWWLERRRPNSFGKRERVELTGEEGGPIEHRTIPDLDDHEKRALRDAIDRELARRTADQSTE